FGIKSWVSRVLRGMCKLTLEHAKKLATGFGFSPALFFFYREVRFGLHPALQCTI
ncbi:MAG: hypothetical protein SO021_12820, partial [Escherichia coli]|nr:hypothetical protein [Escherichia coli]